MDWSFIICTDGKTNLHFHKNIIKSIENQNIPNYEIIFVTENNTFTTPGDKNIITIYFNPSFSKKDGHITFKKNIGARAAQYENLCILHDYLILSENWYPNFVKFGYDWNVCSTQILNKNGNRLTDWMVYNHPTIGHSLVDYNFDADKHHYVPGLAFCVKRDFILKNPLDETLYWGEGEDIEWSSRINDIWNYKINMISSLISSKQK